VLEVVIGLVMKGHLEDKVEVKVIHFDIRLLIVVLMNLQFESIFGQRNVNLFPHLELCIGLHQYSNAKVDLVQSHDVFVSDMLFLFFNYNI